jgi:hypothetical protein
MSIHDDVKAAEQRERLAKLENARKLARAKEITESVQKHGAGPETRQRQIDEYLAAQDAWRKRRYRRSGPFVADGTDAGMFGDSKASDPC